MTHYIQGAHKGWCDGNASCFSSGTVITVRMKCIYIVLYKVYIIFPQSVLHSQRTFPKRRISLRAVCAKWALWEDDGRQGEWRCRRHGQRLLAQRMNPVSGNLKRGATERNVHTWHKLKRFGHTGRRDNAISQRRGNCNNGVDCCPSPSLQFRFITLWLTSFWSPERCTPRTPFYGRRRGETACVKSSDASVKSFTWP